MLFSHKISRNTSNCLSNLCHQNGNIAVCGLISRFLNLFKKTCPCLFESKEEIKSFYIDKLSEFVDIESYVVKTMMTSILHDNFTLILRTKKNWPAPTDQFIFTQPDKDELRYGNLIKHTRLKAIYTNTPPDQRKNNSIKIKIKNVIAVQDQGISNV